MEKKPNRKKSICIVSIIVILFCLLSLSFFSYNIFKINIVPTKYLIIGYGGLLLILLILLWIVLSKKNKLIKSIAFFIMTIMSLGLGYATYYLNHTYHFLNNAQTGYDTLAYSVVVLKNSAYDDIHALKNRIISYLDDGYKEDVQKELSAKITYTESLSSDFSTLPELLLHSQVDSIVLEDSYLTLAYEEIEGFEENTKTIYTFEVRVKSHKEESTVNVIEEPFILYISGIDQYGNVNSVRGRSDVNQLVVVNPKTHHILLVNTPRDYYVQLAGTTGLKDKLTHAGIYGIDKSIQTLENLYDIDIHYYLRVNFNTLIQVVDVIGGIDIYSDSSFTCWTNRKVHVEKGWNHFNGEQALAYARERHAYLTGDHHRGANQQQVITAIIDKVTKSSVLISKYSSILNALDGSFQTDVPIETITSFIKYQIDKIPTWTVESIAVTGYNSMNYTYSMGTRYQLYVMEPDYDSIENVKKRMNEVLLEGN